MTAQEYLTSHGQPNNEYICNLLIGFAKHHVKDALEAAEKEAVRMYEGCSDAWLEECATSIRNTYPLENIK